MSMPEKPADTYAYRAAERAYKSESEYPFDESALLAACREYHRAIVLSDQFAEDYAIWVNLTPEQREQLRQLCTVPEDDGSGVSPIITTVPGASYKRAVRITDARARSERYNDL